MLNDFLKSEGILAENKNGKLIIKKYKEKEKEK